jgi:hypothetical protein
MQVIFVFSKAWRQAEGPTQRLQWVLWTLFATLKRPEREAGNLHLSLAEVNNAWCYSSTLAICLKGVVLKLSTAILMVNNSRCVMDDDSVHALIFLVKLMVAYQAATC